MRILVGAPGVGKTTTLAKLAARNEEGERDVALISLDQFRVGAGEQLRCYAKLLEAPFVEAGRISDLPALIQRFDQRAILVDTAGRGPGHEEGFESPVFFSRSTRVACFSGARCGRDRPTRGTPGAVVSIFSLEPGIGSSWRKQTNAIR